MMGLFSFPKYNQIEKALLEQYTNMISMTGIPLPKARKMAEDMLNQTIEESKKTGSYYLPQNMGDIILGDAKSDNPVIEKIAESLRQKLPEKKAEGVRDEDIRWWWNLNDIERRMMLAHDNVTRIALYAAEIDKHKKQSQEKAAENAAATIKKFFPMYSDPEDTTHTSGDDRPLPYELKDRINIYTEKRARADLEKYKREIEKASSFNALVRKEIKAGNL